MPPEPESLPNSPVTSQAADQPDAAAPPDAPAPAPVALPDVEALLAERRSQTRRLVLIRLSLLGFSTAGVAGAVLLWVAGRGGLGLRVLAGDLLMILFVLLLF